MGTNYYLHTEACPCCGRSDEPLHIGKSSAGWHFSLHIMPERNINTLDDWMTLWSAEGVHIENEYGHTINADEMFCIVTKRKGNENWQRSPHGYTSWEAFHRQNCSEQGIRGLVAHRYNARRTDGTYDLIEGEFS